MGNELVGIVRELLGDDLELVGSELKLLGVAWELLANVVELPRSELDLTACLFSAKHRESFKPGVRTLLTKLGIKFPEFPWLIVLTIYLIYLLINLIYI